MFKTKPKEILSKEDAEEETTEYGAVDYWLGQGA
jgi:hypothetical protein